MNLVELNLKCHELHTSAGIGLFSGERLIAVITWEEMKEDAFLHIYDRMHRLTGKCNRDLEDWCKRRGLKPYEAQRMGGGDLGKLLEGR